VAPSDYLVQGFSRILLVGKLRTHELKFINEGRKYPYGIDVGRNLKNYKKVCNGQVSRAEYADSEESGFFPHLMDNNDGKLYKVSIL
jgi:hypothetical protein